MTGELRLVAADPRFHESYLAALDEMTADGEGRMFELVAAPEPGFPGLDFSRTRLSDPEVFAQFCAYLDAMETGAEAGPPGWVRGTYRWMIVDDEVVGRISLRHELTPWLLEFGGHIGYGVRTSARRRGYASAALGQMLTIAALHGIDPALVTCDEDNIASRGVIEANGGILEDVRGVKRRYWVPAPRRAQPGS